MDPTMPFDDDEMNEEVKNMIDLGLLKLDWADGLNRQEAHSKFQRILSTGEPSYNLTRRFDDDNISEEVKNMRALGLEVHDEFRQIMSPREAPSYSLTRPFDDNISEEIKKMRALGLEVHDEFRQLLSPREAPSYSLTRPFDNDNISEEIKKMRALGLFESDSADGFSRREVHNEFQQRLSTREAYGGAVGSVNERIVTDKNLPDSMNTQRPQSLHGKRKTGKKFKLKRLSPEDPVFKQISANFKDIQSIKAIQIVTNETQQKIFEIEQKFLKDCHDDDFNLNVKDLYHGTIVSKDDICTYGLDLRLSRQGLFGKGIYFSDDVKKCEKYLLKGEGGSIYVCAVILGDMKVYPDSVSALHLKTEPKKPNGEIYNSVKGNMDGFNEFVIYENRRSLIKYRIVLEEEDDEDDEDDDEDDEEEPATDELDDESNSILQQFLKMTDCGDEEFAKMIVKGQNFDLDNSVSYYHAIMGI